MSSRPLVIYHGGCCDGFCAAWIINLYYKGLGIESEFFAGYYGQNPPDCRNRDVIIVDFSYSVETIRNISNQSKTLKIFDHHKTAYDNLKEFINNPLSNMKVVFDMDQSGAGLVYLYYFGTKGKTERPWIVDYVEDRDLWRFNLPNSKEVNAYIGVLPYEFNSWDVALLNGIYCATKEGKGIIAKINQYVSEVCKNALWIEFEGYHIPIVNVPHVDISEVVGSMAEGQLYQNSVITPPFAIGWFQRADGMFQYSLRSRGDFDVSVIAKKYGGGGHKNAAGFESKNMLHVRCTSY